MTDLEKLQLRVELVKHYITTAIDKMEEKKGKSPTFDIILDYESDVLNDILFMLETGTPPPCPHYSTTPSEAHHD